MCVRMLVHKDCVGPYILANATAPISIMKQGCVPILMMDTLLPDDSNFFAYGEMALRVRSVECSRTLLVL
jgi:hypothetical protein